MTATRVTLGRSGLNVSPICYGSWQLSPSCWGDQPEALIAEAMRRAFDLGVNFYDTADAYGDGLSEHVLGNALRDLPRDELVVATKVYHNFYHEGGQRTGDLSPEHIRFACDQSLQRLGMDYVDLYQCHTWDVLGDPREIAQAMNDLVKQGKIRAYGTSNWSVEQMRLGDREGSSFDTIQPPYSLLNTGIESDVLPYALAHNLGVLVYSPLHRGLLTGKFTGDESFAEEGWARGGHVDYQGQRFKELCERVAKLQPIADRNEMSITQLTLAATLAHPAIHCAIVGIKNPKQIEEAAAVMGRSLSRLDYYSVRSTLAGE